MTITTDELIALIKKECDGKLIVDHRGQPLFGKIIILTVNNGHAVHGETGPDVDVVVRQTFKL